MFEQIIVGAIVAAAAASVCWRWVPKHLRLSFKDRVTKSLLLSGYARFARWIDNKSMAAPGCGDGCSTCQACNAPSSSNSVSPKTIVINYRHH